MLCTSVNNSCYATENFLKTVAMTMQDLKNDKARAQMGSARSVLERSTMMLLTTSKTLLRHQECDAARKIRNSVFFQMRRALERIDYIVTNGVYTSSDLSPSTGVDGDSGISLSQQPCSAFRLEKEFQVCFPHCISHWLTVIWLLLEILFEHTIFSKKYIFIPTCSRCTHTGTCMHTCTPARTHAIQVNC